jgi:CubicO group peptidase (beta-lactamase class C family)
MTTLRLILCFAMAAGLAGPVAAQTTPPASALSAYPTDVPGFISAYASEQALQGVVRVERGGQTLYHGAFGTADRAFNVPVAEDTRFRVASITKMFASVLMLQLQEEGRVRLDDRVERYLPDLLGEAGARVTLRQLLNHTSGLAQLDTIASYEEGAAKGIPHYQQPMTPAALVANCCTGALKAEPGTAFDYNNADYILLAAIIEQVTGRSWEAELQDRILTPLGLADTGVAHWDAIIPRLAPTYSLREADQVMIADMPVYYENWSASGALYSTAADLTAFANALYGGRLLRPDSLEQFLAPALDDYGLGLWSYSFERRGRTWNVAKRPGAIMGARGVVYRLREADLTIVILANTNGVDLDVFAQRIANRWIDANIAER